jgi:hypothetical protein
VTAAPTIPQPLAHVLPRWKELVKRWALKPEERAALVGGPDRDVDAFLPLEDYRLLCGEQRIRLMVEVDAVFGRIVGDDAAVRGWLRRPNLNLGDRRPIDVMAGTPEWMQWLIDNLGAAR